jgi:RnfABCDGE-type electron transport complex G subunit
MEKQMPVWASVALVVVVSAVLLVSTHLVTQVFAQPEGVIGKDSPQGAVLSAADSFVPVELAADVGIDNCYEGKAGDKTVGYVAQATVKGYGGPIELVVGMDLNGALTGVSVGGEQFNETPGLGARSQEPEFTAQFVGLIPPVSRGGEGASSIDAISGATITTDAVLSGVNQCAEVMMTLPGVSAQPAEQPAEQPQAEPESAPEAEQAAQQAATEDSPQRAVLGAAETFAPVEVGADSGIDSCYEGKAGGETVGYVAQVTVKGYGGPIELMVGMDLNGVLTGVSVGGAQFSETPGLGAKAQESAFTDQFAGLKTPVGEGTNTIDAISGATITTGAVVSGVNQCAEFMKTLPGVNG